MRDLKCAQKLKSAYSTSHKASDQPTYERKNSIHNIMQTTELGYEDPHETGKEIMRRMSIGNKSAVDLSNTGGKVKRSQTFSSATLPRNYGGGGKVRGTILQGFEQGGTNLSQSTSTGYLNNNEADGENNFANEESASNSQFSLLNENSRNFNHCDQGIA